VLGLICCFFQRRLFATYTLARYKFWENKPFRIMKHGFSENQALSISPGVKPLYKHKMDKLIVTIIAISLGSVTLLWGADYISGFYQAAQSKAKAQAWIAGAAQIAVAARQAGSLSTTNDNWIPGSGTATAAQLVPDYMSDLPKYNGAYAFQPCILGSNVLCPEYNTDANVLMAAVENQKVCEYINMQANRNNSVIPASGGFAFNVSGVLYTEFTNLAAFDPHQQFSCINGLSAYYLFYRVFMDR